MLIQILLASFASSSTVRPSRADPAVTLDLVCRLRFGKQSNAYRPRLRFDARHRNAQSPCDRGYQAALDEDGEDRYDHDDPVEPFSTGYIRCEKKLAEQDRHRPLESSEQHKQALPT